MIKRKIVIIGAGPCGLGAAYRLKELGFCDFVVLEKEKYVGGLSASFSDKNGFVWDIGGHVVHSHYDYFSKVFFKLLSGKYLEHERESWIWILNKFVPYPFQNNLHYLPKKAQWECIQGLLEVALQSKKIRAENFEEWILSVFGKGIAKYFLLPYNFKVWAHPAKKMSKDWIADRVSVINIERAIQNTFLEKDDISWGPNNMFQYPLKGGTGFIWESAKNCLPENNFLMNSEVVEVDIKKNYLKTRNGQEIFYKHLISTAPIVCLSEMAKLQQNLLLKKYLNYSTVHVVGLGFKGKAPKHLKTKCWMYFPEDNSLFFRATVLSNYSPFNVPDSEHNWSLMFEVSESRYRTINKKTLVKDVIVGAKNSKLINNKTEIISKWLYTAPFAYPIPTLSRDKIINKTLLFLEKNNIYSRGRFGAWKYEVANLDHSFMQGVEVVNRLLKGEEEVTVWKPNKVNK